MEGGTKLPPTDPQPLNTSGCFRSPASRGVRRGVCFELRQREPAPRHSSVVRLQRMLHRAQWRGPHLRPFAAEPYLELEVEQGLRGAHVHRAVSPARPPLAALVESRPLGARFGLLARDAANQHGALLRLAPLQVGRLPARVAQRCDTHTARSRSPRDGRKSARGWPNAVGR